MGSSVNDSEKLSHARAVISALGLDNVLHSIVGDEQSRGLSGGERKRLNIGIELAAAPLLLLLDEPTSGLDSSAALDLCQVPFCR
jgi:ABC-type multidrug transport system ATPase subunit